MVGGVNGGGQWRRRPLAWSAVPKGQTEMREAVVRKG